MRIHIIGTAAALLLSSLPAAPARATATDDHIPLRMHL